MFADFVGPGELLFLPGLGLRIPREHVYSSLLSTSRCSLAVDLTRRLSLTGGRKPRRMPEISHGLSTHSNGITRQCAKLSGKNLSR